MQTIPASFHKRTMETIVTHWHKLGSIIKYRALSQIIPKKIYTKNRTCGETQNKISWQMVSVPKKSLGLSILPTPTRMRAVRPFPVVSRKNSSTSTFCDIRLITILRTMSCRFRTVSENSRKTTIQLTRSASGCMRKLKCISKRSISWLLKKRVSSSSSRPKIRKSKS